MSCWLLLNGGGTQSYLPSLSEIIWIKILMYLFGREGHMRRYVFTLNFENVFIRIIDSCCIWNLASAIIICDTSHVSIKNDRVWCFISLDQSCYHGPCSAMCQHKLLQYQRINIPPHCCVRLLQSEHSKDPSNAEMSGLSEENPLTIVVMVMKCKHKQLRQTCIG